MVDKENLIYVALLGAAIGDAMPTLADFYYFKKQQKLKESLEKNEITPKQYWQSEAIAYYTYNSAYWLLIGTIVYAVKGDFDTKLKVALGLVAGGAVLSVIHKNISKDTEFYKTHELTLKPKE